MFRIPLATVLAFLSLVGCKRSFHEAGGSKVMEGEGQASQLSEKSLALWDQYVTSASKHPLQEGCKPRHVTLPEGVEYKGFVILFHGFTACPQQFFELSERLAKQGFEVFLPLLPGHGIIPGPRKQMSDDFLSSGDEIEFVPNAQNGDKALYQDLAKSMNAIASNTSRGARVVGGLSVGGAVATAAVNAAPSLYDRALIMAPLYLATSHLLRDVLKVTAVVDGLPLPHFLSRSRKSWGEGCLTERTGGRAGICDFYFGSVITAQDFGRETLRNIKRVPSQIQFISAEDDDVANPAMMKSAIDHFRENTLLMRILRFGVEMQVPTVSACFFQHGVPHSFLSRFDNPDKPKPWLPEVLQHASEFLARGTPYPMIAGRTSAITPEGTCQAAVE